MISASNLWRSAARTISLAAPRTTWNAVRICPSSPTTTPEPKSNEIMVGRVELATETRLAAGRARRSAAGRFLPRTASVSCGLSPFSRWIATTEGSARAIASATTVSRAETRSRGEGCWAGAPPGRADRPGRAAGRPAGGARSSGNPSLRETESTPIHHFQLPASGATRDWPASGPCREGRRGPSACSARGPPHSTGQLTASEFLRIVNARRDAGRGGVRLAGDSPPTPGHSGGGLGRMLKVGCPCHFREITTSGDRVEGARFHAAVLGSPSGSRAGRVVARVQPPDGLLGLAGRRAGGGGPGPGAGREG